MSEQIRQCGTGDDDTDKCLPQILSGASSSRRIGWLKKISRDFKQRPLTSASANCTVFPGRHPRTDHVNKSEVK